MYWPAGLSIFDTRRPIILNTCHHDSVLMMFSRVIKLNFLIQATVFSDVNYIEKHKYVCPDYISVIQTLMHGLCSCLLKHKSTPGILVGNKFIKSRLTQVSTENFFKLYCKKKVKYISDTLVPSLRNCTPLWRVLHSNISEL